MTRELHTKGLQTHERKSLARVGHWCGDSGGSRCGMLVSAHPPRSDLSRVRGPQNMLRHPQFLERVLKSRIRACRSFWTAHVLAAATLLLPLGIRRVLYWGGWYRRRFGVLPLRSLNGGAGLGSVTDDGRSEEHTSELQSHLNLVCRLLLEKKKLTQLTYRINA